MEDPAHKKDPIKVVDRRPFTPDGLRREPDEAGDEVASAPAVQPSRPSAPPREARSAASSSAPVRGEGFVMEPPPLSEEEKAVEEAAFVNLVVSIYQSGAIHLGLDAEEGSPPAPPDIDAARGDIEIMAMLKKKTRGNLSVEETRILDTLLAELQMAFAMKAPGD